jgi:hypothetical protein
MHRSGTSALSRTLNLLGASLPQDLLGPSANNPLGHWEPRLAYELNNEILEEMGSSWSALEALPDAWFVSPEAEAYAQRAAEFLVGEFADKTMFVLKEPRICLLVPIWMRAMQIADMDPKIIVPIRRPDEVARSLNARSGMPLSYGELVWLRNILQGEFSTRGLPRCFVTYDRLLEDWREVIDGVAASLDIAWPERTLTAEAEIDQFLSPEHRHHALDGADSLPWLVGALESLQTLVEEAHSSEAMARLDAIRAEFDRASQVFQPVVTDMQAEAYSRADAKRHQVKRQRQDLERRLSETQAALDEQAEQVQVWKEATGRVALELGEKAKAAARAHDAELDSQRARLREALDLIARLKDRVDRLERVNTELAALNTSLAEEANARVEAERSIDRLRNDLRAAAQTLSDAKFKRNLKIKELGEELSQARQKLGEVEAAFEQSQTALQAALHDRQMLTRSTSWRVTKPLRWISRAGRMRPRIGLSSEP